MLHLLKFYKCYTSSNVMYMSVDTNRGTNTNANINKSQTFMPWLMWIRAAWYSNVGVTKFHPACSPFEPSFQQFPIKSFSWCTMYILNFFPIVANKFFSCCRCWCTFWNSLCSRLLLLLMLLLLLLLLKKLLVLVHILKLSSRLLLLMLLLLLLLLKNFWCWCTFWNSQAGCCSCYC